jgi:hypothetical protein
VDCVDLESSEDETTDENDTNCFLVSVESKLIRKGFSSLVAEIQVFSKKMFAELFRY